MSGWTSFNGKEPVKMSHEHKEGYKDPMVKSLVPSPITYIKVMWETDQEKTSITHYFWTNVQISSCSRTKVDRIFV